MLSTFSAACALLAMVLLLRSILWTRRFLSAVAAEKLQSDHSGSDVPKAVVVLPVRGKDPFLARCIESLLDQNYANYVLRIIVDSESDPAVPVIEQAVNLYSNDRVQVEFLYEALPTCGAKNSALIQIIDSLEADDSAIVVVDSDVVVYRDWLRDLMLPLQNPEVGVATGIRWFTPKTSELGTLVRYIWNVGAVPEMFAFQIPFGGSTAYRRDVLEGGLAERWSQCLFDDCAVPSVLKSMGLELRVVPRAIMGNCESISLVRCFEYLRRQMLNAVCYHPARRLILTGSLAMAVSVFGSIAAMITAAVEINIGAFAIAATGVFGFAAGMAGCLVALESRLRSILRESGQPVPPFPTRAIRLGWLAVLMYTVATVCACFARRVTWRGLNYDRVSHDRFQLEEHRPFAPGAVHVEHASV